ncbi:alpha/beta fold hydrolase [Lysobacter korlensis]|uniref:Alpha/beta fold hydrolase n=1 Tax=Lysobacter korlensis TaxID=553636 RepID=A0ABV6RRQ3_9GAMM
MRTENFDFTGESGQRLSGQLDLPPGPATSYALFAHCFTCTKSSLAAVRVSQSLTARGYGVLRFDFTGLGQSTGEFADSSFSGSTRDVIAAARAMADAGLQLTLLIGHSLGGAAVLAAAGELPAVVAIATIGAPFDVEHVTRLFGPQLDTIVAAGEAEVQLGGRPFTIRRSFVDDLATHDQGARIAALGRPLLVLHSPLDRVVGIDNAGAIFGAARHPKSFVSLDDADHLLTDRHDADYVAEVVAAWASRYLEQPLPLRSAAQPGEVSVEETGVGLFQVQVHAGAAHFLADEPAEVGGLGSGPTPYDLVSAGLGACTAMTLRLYARGKGLKLDKVSVRVGHRRRADGPPADVFVRRISLEGDLTPQQRTRLIEIAERCPVHRTLERGAIIETAAGDRIDAGDVEQATQHAEDMATLSAHHPAPDEAPGSA